MDILQAVAEKVAVLMKIPYVLHDLAYGPIFKMAEKGHLVIPWWIINEEPLPTPMKGYFYLRVMCLHLHWTSNVQPCNSEILFQNNSAVLTEDKFVNNLYCFGNDNSIHLQQTKRYKYTEDSRVFHRSSQISSRQPSIRQTKQKKLDKRLFSLNLYLNASSLCFAGESHFCTKCKVFYIFRIGWCTVIKYN